MKKHTHTGALKQKHFHGLHSKEKRKTSSWLLTFYSIPEFLFLDKWITNISTTLYTLESSFTSLIWLPWKLCEISSVGVIWFPLDRCKNRSSGWGRILPKYWTINVECGARSCNSKLCQWHACLDSKRPPEITWQIVSTSYGINISFHTIHHATILVVSAKAVSGHKKIEHQTKFYVFMNSWCQQIKHVANSPDMSQSEPFGFPRK